MEQSAAMSRAEASSLRNPATEVDCDGTPLCKCAECQRQRGIVSQEQAWDAEAGTLETL